MKKSPYGFVVAPSGLFGKRTIISNIFNGYRDMLIKNVCRESDGERADSERLGDQMIVVGNAASAAVARARQCLTGLGAIAAVVALAAPAPALAQYAINGTSTEMAGCVGNTVISGSATYPASATGCDNTALGIAATANSGTQNYSDATALGGSATAIGLHTTALGGHSYANGDEATAVGEGAFANGATASAFGQGASAVNNATALGQGAVASNVGDVALGAGSVTAAANPTSGATIGGNTYTFAGANPTSVVSVGSVGAERQITNVAAGQISATSTDAVNGSQLFATNSEINRCLRGCKRPPP